MKIYSMFSLPVPLYRVSQIGAETVVYLPRSYIQP